ncbi:MAG: Ig-like domain-containing protein [Roseburia intestinalis]
MRERRNRKGMNTAKVAGWKKAVVLTLALIMCISSIVVPQPEEVSAKQATYIDYFGKDQPKNQIVFATSDDAKWHKANEGCCNVSKNNGTYNHYHCMKKKTVYAGEKFTIVPVAMFKNGVVVGSKNSKDGIKSGELKYKSSNTSIATVNAKGVVTVKKKGKCKITVTSIYDSKVKGTLSLTVSKGKQKAKITLKEKKASIVVGKTTTIKVKSFKGISNKNIAFSSSDKKVATVSSKGKVTGKKAGKATITVTSLINKNVKAKFTITVKTADMIDTDYSEKGKGKIVLEEDNVVLYPEKSFHKIYDHCGDAHSLEYYTEDHESMDQFIGEQLLVQKEKYGQAQIKVKRITGVKNSAVSYKSSNTSVAAVSSTGFVTPKKVGTATITVTSKANKKVQAKYKVTVKKNDMVLAVGFDMYDNIKYYVKKNDDGTIENRSMVVSTEFFSADKKVAESCDYSYNIASNNKIIMTSSNENVLRVTADERLEVIGRGSSIITLKTADGRWSYSWKVTVSDKQTSFSKYVTGFRTGKGMDEDDEKYGFVTKL